MCGIVCAQKVFASNHEIHARSETTWKYARAANKRSKLMRVKFVVRWGNMAKPEQWRNTGLLISFGRMTNCCPQGK